ncbi:MAG TPA: hypothetical protein PLO14_05065 [Accumulibacter sp.]|nr:hypothetical protein [Accumulibacter sp.]
MSISDISAASLHFTAWTQTTSAASPGLLPEHQRFPGASITTKVAAAS